MSSMSYDAAKLPLGKLSKSTISQGYQVLKDLGEVIEEAPGWQRDYAEYGRTKNDILIGLSNRYYSIIPHVFPGRSRPTIIDKGYLLKQEVSLVENLADMVITTKLLKETKAGGSSDVNVLDKQFDSLNLNEATALDHASKEFNFLEAYAKKTHGHTHRQKLRVEEIFRVHRAVEEDRWRADGWDKLPSSDRRLLWHGSRTTNFPGILSQGLRIAPPEAPVNGYMFDKGIYLADIVSKSANYCCASASDNTGLLLLCEAQLGDPMYECQGADYRAATKCKQAGRLATKGLGLTVPLKWEDAGVVHEDLRGVQMPMVTGQEANVTGDAGKGNSLSLQYNEVCLLPSLLSAVERKLMKSSTLSTTSRRSRLGTYSGLSLVRCAMLCLLPFVRTYILFTLCSAIVFWPGPASTGALFCVLNFFCFQHFFPLFFSFVMVVVKK